MSFRSNLIRFLIAVALVTFASVIAEGQTRVQFARGATRATVRGYLRGINDQADFVLRLKSGQRVHIEIKGRGATRGVLIYPSGKQDGGPGGVIFDDRIDETGDYRVRVTESSMANAWRGSFTLVVDATGNDSGGGDNQNLARYVGRYPSELLKGVPSLRTRLRALLAANYRPFFDRLQTEMPIVKDEGALIVRGCKAHSCGLEEAILAINLDDGSLHCAIKSNSTFRTFSENRSRLPSALNRAMRQ